MRKRGTMPAILALLFWVTPLFAARLFTCGFEENHSGFVTTMWTGIVGTTPTIQSTTVHSGTYALRSNSAASARMGVYRSLTSAKTSGTISTRIYFYIADTPDTLPQSIFILGNANSSANGGGPIEMQLITGPKLRLKNNLTSTSTDGTTTLSLNQWYRIELKTVIADSPNGSVELLLDGNIEASQTATDTLDGAVGFNKCFIGIINTPNTNFDVFYDDIAWNDETGSFQTGYPGAGKIALMSPASDVAVAWTKAGSTPAATNWQGVNDVPGTPNDGTDYNQDGGTTNVDRLGLTSLPAEVTSNATMKLLDVYGRMGSDAATARTMIFRVWNESGTSADGPSIDVALNGWKTNSTTDHQVYDLSGKTKANVNSFNAGYKGNSGNSRNKNVSALWANVEWIEAPSGPAVLPRVVRW